MKLRRLVLHGFKSFADRTELRFHEGVTAIVGPNGCGKSNISDAIRWALGEQRASAIRSSRMEEAIFQGTQERRAVNRAEVALIFSNEERRLAVPYDEIDMRRMVFREGGSEYQLNQTPCRLRDILDLCRDTGLGANAYAVIEQGMIDAILSDRAEERRHLFEEAAGIGRYKDRRKAAQRRLEAAENDLARLEDVIGEVETKVRSLARQRKRAERYLQMRARRLALELALATYDLAELRSALEATAARLQELAHAEPAARAALSGAEAELATRRLEAAEATRARNEVAARLDSVTRRIAERERELAVTDERWQHSERRLEQIAAEREELRAQLAGVAAERERLEAERVERLRELEALRARGEIAQERQQQLRAVLADARGLDEQARARENELLRALAQAEADAAGADARARDAAGRLERLEAEEEALEGELSHLDEQADLFAEAARRLAAARAQQAATRDGRRTLVEDARREELAVKQSLAQAEDLADRLAARVATLETLERDFHGFSPLVAAALGARDRLDGIVGALVDLLRLPHERAAAVESALGPLLQALVLRDRGAAEQVRDWLAGEPTPGGPLAMLPRDALPLVEELVARLEFAGQPEAEPVLIGRQERLERLRADAATAASACRARGEARMAAAARVAELEAQVRDAEARLQALELELRHAEADDAARSSRRERSVASLEELRQQQSGLAGLVDRSRGEAAAAREAHGRLQADLEARRAEWRGAADALSEREAAWEAARLEETDLRVAQSKAEGELQTLAHRLETHRLTTRQTEGRLHALDREEQEHRQSVQRLGDLRTAAAAQLEQLFRERDEINLEVRVLDDRAAAVAEAAEALELRVRQLRQQVDEQGEERHRLELLRTESGAAERRVRERLEVEWGRAFDRLAAETEPAQGDAEVLRGELQALSADIERLGAINMLAVEDYEEESKRLAFLTGQRADLAKAHDDLLSAIRSINRTARQLFEDTFERIRVNFRRTFNALFEGGECDVWLADPEDPLEAPIEISASPRGKRTQRIHQLSGGEKALCSLALLFAIYLVKPSPFCVLDEVDAPLDEANIGRFLSMLKQFKQETQFIVITHNPRTMEAADWIYGVTMEEPGVSTVVGVQLDEVLAGVAAGA